MFRVDMDFVPGSPVKKKRKYEKLSLDQKVQIIRAAEMGYSQRTLASQYNCGKTQIHLLVTQKDMWLSKWERSRKHNNFSRVHSSASCVSNINNLVWDFYKKACLHDVIITGPMLQERAQQIADSLCVPNFVSNPGWLEKFMEEFNVKVPSIPSSSTESEQDLPPKNVSHSIDSYDESNVYCLGIVELSYRLIPCLTTGIHDHLTVCFVASACGKKSIASLVFMENACAEGELWNVNVPCFSSPMGHVTIEVYQHTLDVLNEKMAQENRKILLFVSAVNFPEEIVKDMSHINILTWSQDEQCADFSNRFRLLYCKRLLTSLAATFYDWNDLGHHVKTLPIWKLMRLVQSAWNLIPSEVVKHLFKTVAINTATVDFPKNIKQDLQEISELINVLKSSGNKNTGGKYDYSLQISEEIFGIEHKERVENLHDEEDCCNDIIQHDPVSAIPESEAISTLISLEMFVQTLSDGAKYQRALDLIDELERTIEELLVKKKSN